MLWTSNRNFSLSVVGADVGYWFTLEWAKAGKLPLLEERGGRAAGWDEGSFGEKDVEVVGETEDGMECFRIAVFIEMDPRDAIDSSSWCR